MKLKFRLYQVTFKISIGDNSILAISKATFPCPIIVAVSTFKLNSRLLSSGKPLYHPTNFLAETTFFKFSPGTPNHLSCAAP